MPSDDPLPRVADDLALVNQWCVSGTHDARTARAWLERVDGNREAARAVLATHLGPRRAAPHRTSAAPLAAVLPVV
jgi:cyclopropane-fatty-acyl-phospholipid synthase